MPGQVWHTNTLGGYMFAPNLSMHLRMVTQPRTKYRQFSSLPESQNNAKNKGDTFNWNIYSRVATKGRAITEDETMPETNFSVTQNSLTVDEYGNSVPYTGRLDDLSEHPVREIIDQVMKIDAAEVMDDEAYAEFVKTPLIAEAAGGNSATEVTLATNGTPTATNDIAMGKKHVRRIVKTMQERNIPTYDHGDYYAIGRPLTFLEFEEELEEINQYTGEGFSLIRNGEIGRYAGCRFVQQTNIADKGWSNGKSDEVVFFGDDPVAEGCVIPEEVRGAIPTDFGRKKGVAWLEAA